MRIENCPIGSIVLATRMVFVNNGQSKNFGIKTTKGIHTLLESMEMPIHTNYEIERVFKI